MTKKDAKHLAEVLEAYSKGKTIQFRSRSNIAEPKEWRDITRESWFDLSQAEYRIKPEPKYRPYANAEEFLKAQKEHGMYLKFKEYYHLPLEVNDKGVVIKLVETKYSLVLQDYKFQDGTPCGIMEEQV